MLSSELDDWKRVRQAGSSAMQENAASRATRRHEMFRTSTKGEDMWWGIGGVAVVLWLVLFIWLGLRTLRNGHGWMFFLGIFFPILWIFGALAGPADRPT